MSKHSLKQGLNSESDVDEGQFEIIELKETMAEDKNFEQGKESSKKDESDGSAAMANTPRPGPSTVHLDKGQDMSPNKGDVHIEVAEAGGVNEVTNQGQSDNGGIAEREPPGAPSDPTPIRRITAGDVKNMMKKVNVGAGPWSDGTVKGIVYGLKGLRFLFLKDKLSLFNFWPVIAIIIGITHNLSSNECTTFSNVIISGGVIQLAQGFLARQVQSQKGQPNAGETVAHKISKLLNSALIVALLAWLITAAWIVFPMYSSNEDEEYRRIRGIWRNVGTPLRNSCGFTVYYFTFWFLIADIVVLGSLLILKIFI